MTSFLPDLDLLVSSGLTIRSLPPISFGLVFFFGSLNLPRLINLVGNQYIDGIESDNLLSKYDANPLNSFKASIRQKQVDRE